MSKKPGRNHPGLSREKWPGRREAQEDSAELVQRSDVHPNRMSQWRAQLRGGAAGGGAFGLYTYLHRERHGPVPRLPAQ